jgi:hypothetical protein
MGLFDIIKDKAAELFSGAGDKVNELTGTELPGTDAAADQLAQSADNVGDTAQDLSGSVSEAADSAITDATDPDKK